MTNPLGTTSSSASGFVPPQINNLDDTGLSPLWLQELALKLLYFRGYLTGFRISEEMAMPFAGIVDQILQPLKTEKLIEEHRGGWLLTSKGQRKLNDMDKRVSGPSQHVFPMPPTPDRGTK